jgi:hypothetical protein
MTTTPNSTAADLAVVFRDQAKAAGLKRFFTGEPCKRGHVAERFVSDRSCVECKAAARKSFAENNPERVRELERQWREANREGARELERQRREANPEKAREKARRWRKANPEKARERCRRWREANPEKAREATRQWEAENLDRINERRREWGRAKYAGDGEYRMQCWLRTTIGRVVAGTAGEGKRRHIPEGRADAIRAKIEADLAAIPDAPKSFDDLDGSEWHLDHIVPVSRMLELLSGETRPVLAYVASHPDMLRPLPAAENVGRGNRIDDVAEGAFDRFVEIVDEACAYHRQPVEAA